MARAVSDVMGIGDGVSVAEVRFREHVEPWVMRTPEIRILELGTLRWEADRPTHHIAWLPGMDWTLSDLTAGTDVDVACDAHQLAPFDDASFDAYVAVSLYEHLARPWLAAQAAARVLRPGGALYVATHQTFPLHGYPDDFFRFSDRALHVLFDDAGFDVQTAGYCYPAKIIPPPEVTRWNPAAEAFLNVDIFAIRK